jgi:hypothetical protein
MNAPPDRRTAIPPTAAAERDQTGGRQAEAAGAAGATAAVVVDATVQAFAAARPRPARCDRGASGADAPTAHPRGHHRAQEESLDSPTPHHVDEPHALAAGPDAVPAAAVPLGLAH